MFISCGSLMQDRLTNTALAALCRIDSTERECLKACVSRSTTKLLIYQTVIDALGKVKLERFRIAAVAGEAVSIQERFCIARHIEPAPALALPVNGGR